MFIRKQLSAYCITVEVKRTFPITYTDEEVLPAMKFTGPAPHWRHDINGGWDRTNSGTPSSMTTTLPFMAHE